MKMISRQKTIKKCVDNKIIQNQSVSVNKKINKNEMIFKKEKHFKYA